MEPISRLVSRVSRRSTSSWLCGETKKATPRQRRHKPSTESTWNECDVLEELGDVLPATLGPHPRVCVVVQRGSHHVLLDLDTVLLTFIAVVMRHVEPGRQKSGLGTRQ